MKIAKSKKCIFCKTIFEKPKKLSDRQFNKRQSCCRKCSDALRRKGEYVKCKTCNKKFYRQRSVRVGIYCSKKCSLKNVLNEKANGWKGNNVGYFGLHCWVRKRLGKPKKCKYCGKKEKLQWANISKKYKRKLDDWIPLCVVCHRRFDKITKLSIEETKTIRKMYKKGITQNELGKKYNVHQSTISNIIRNKIQYYGKNN